MNEIPIIMPVKDRIELTRQTVQTLFQNTKIPFRLIIISDASEEKTNDYLKSVSPATLILMPKNTGAASCKNAGMAIVGDNEYYYITDNDMYFMPNWLEALLKIMEAFPKVGIVGGRNHGYHGILEHKENQGIRIQTALQQAGFSMLVRKEAWLSCGPFLHYSPQDLGKEDVKFCNKVRAANWEIARPPEPVIFHCGIKNTFNVSTAGADSEMKQNFPSGVIVK